MLDGVPSNLRYFTDREEEVAYFERMLDPKSVDWVMLVDGLSGTGKTFLIDWLIWSRCRDIPHVRFEAIAAQDELQFLGDFARLIQNKVPRKAFDRFESTIDELEVELASANISNRIEITAQDAARVEGVKIESTIGEQAAILERAKANTSRKATNAFEQLVGAYRPETLVCFIDTFEQLRDVRRVEWLLGLCYRVRLCLPGFRLVIAGQERINVRSVLDAWFRKPIDVFAPEDAEDYLVNKRRIPEDVASRLMKITAGHPLLMDLCAEEFERAGIDDIGEAAVDVLQGAVGQRAPTVWVYERITSRLEAQGVSRKVVEYTATFPRFNLGMLRFCFPEVDADLAYQSLIERESFVRPSRLIDPPGYYRFHDLVRGYMTPHLHGRDREEFRTYHKRAYEYNSGLLVRNSNDISELFGSSQARTAQMTLFHALWWNMQEGWEFLLRQVAPATAHWRTEYLNGLIGAATSHSQSQSSTRIVHFCRTLSKAIEEVESRRFGKNLIATLELLVDVPNQEPDVEGMLRRSLATLLNRDGRLSKALVHLDRAIGLAIGGTKSRLRRATMFVQHGDFQAAIRDFSVALEEEPGNSEALSGLALAHLKNGDAELAEGSFQSALQNSLESDDLSEIISTANLFAEASRREDSGKLLRHALTLIGDYDANEAAEPWENIGDIHIKRADWIAAEDALRQSLAMDETRPGPWLSLGRALRRQKRWDEAIAAHEKVVGLDLTLAPSAWEHIGDIYLDLEKWEEAEDAIRQSLAMDETRPGPWISLGRALRRQQRWDEAIAAHEKVAELDPDLTPAALEHIGDIYLDQEKWEAAEQMLRQSLELDEARPGPWFSLGKSLRRQQRWGDAIAAYEKVAELDPDLTSAAWEHIGDVYLDQEKWEVAEEMLRRSLALDETRGGAWYSLGKALEGQQRWDEAIAAHEKRAELNPALAHRIYSFIAAMLIHLERIEEAEVWLSKVQAEDVDNEEVLLSRAMILLDGGEPAEAEPLLLQVLKQMSADNLKGQVAAHAMLAKVYARQAQWENAISAHEQIALLDSGLAPAAKENIGDIHLGQMNWGAAEDAIRQSLAMDETRPGPWISLGRALRGQQRWDEAVAAHKKVAELDSDLAPAAWEQIGDVFLDQEKWEAAEEMLHKSLELDQVRPGTWFSLGRALEGQKRWDEAIAALEKVPELGPKLATAAQEMIGRIHLENGNWEAAEHVLRESLAIDETGTAAWAMLGGALEGQQRWDEAVGAHERVGSLDPDLALAAKQKIGYIRLRQENWQAAEEVLRQSLAIDGTQSESLIALGIALERQQRWDQAIAVWGQVIESDSELSALAWERIGDIHLEQSEWKKAEQALTQAVALDAARAGVWHSLARALEGQQLWDEAIAAYQRVVELDPEQVHSVYNHIATRMHELGRDEEAEDWLSRSAVRETKDMKDILFRAVALQRMGQFAEAEHLLQPVLARRTSHDLQEQALAHFIFAQICSGQERWNEALSAYQEVSALDADLEVPALLGIAEIYLQQRNWKAAEDALQKSLTLGETDSAVWSMLADSLEGQQSWDEAIAVHRNLLDLGPDLASAANERIGDIYLKQENWGAAEGALRQSIALDETRAGAWYSLGRALQGQQRWDEAIDAHTTVTELGSGLAGAAWEQVGDIHLKQESWQAAEEALRHSLSVDETRAGAWASLGNVLEAQERWDEAIAAHGEVARFALGAAPAAKERIGDLYLKQENWSAAEDALRQSIALDETRAGAWYSLGRVLRGQRRWEEAIDAFTRVTELDPELAPAAWEQVGDVYLKQESWQEAEEALRYSLELDETRAGTWASLGNALEAQECWDEAIAAHEEVARLVTAWAPAAKERIGQIYLKQEDWRMAEESLRHSIALDKTRASAWIMLGEALQGQQRIEDADQLYKRLANPDSVSDARDALRRAEALYDADHPEGVEALIRRSLDISGSDDRDTRAMAYTILGRIRSDQGDSVEAEDFFDQAVRLAPDRVDPLIWLSDIYGLQQRWDRAIAAHHRIRELDPSLEPQAWEHIGNIYLKQEDWSAAGDALSKALALQETSSGAWYSLGKALEGQHRWQEAIAAHKRVAELDAALFEDANLYVVQILREQLADLPGAFTLLESLLEDADHSISVEAELIITLLRTSRSSEAEQRAVRVLEDLNARPELQTDSNCDALGTVFLRRLDQPVTAMAIFRKGLQHDSENVGILMDLARCYEHPESLDTAQMGQVYERMKRMLREKRDDPGSIRRLAWAEFKTLDFQLASELATQAYATAGEVDRKRAALIQAYVAVVNAEFGVARDTLADLLMDRLRQWDFRWELSHDLSAVRRSCRDIDVQNHVARFLDLMQGDFLAS